jgi:cell shape-determining protein MreC
VQIPSKLLSFVIFIFLIALTRTTSPTSGSADELNAEERCQLALERISSLLKEKQTYEAELAKLRSSLDEQMSKSSEPTQSTYFT